MPKPTLRLFSDCNPTGSESEGTSVVEGSCSSGPPKSQPGEPGCRDWRRRQQELDRIAGAEQARTVAVPLGSIIPLLLDAVENNRAWVSDFKEETVRIDADLYDVLLAYQQLRRPAVA